MAGPTFPDPFVHDRTFGPTFLHAILATALFRCWYILLLFGAWATAICVISAKVVNLGISSSLLTVLGTVLGFVISYRTTSSFERYNEGRRYWSQMIYSSRTLARLIWFHVPDTMEISPDVPAEELRARILVEKKTVLNLIDGFCVAVKHYLRGEEGINYEDLYHVVKFLPSYALPAGMAPQVDNRDSTSLKEQQQSEVNVQHHSSVNPRRGSFPGGAVHRSPGVRSGGTLTNSESAPHLPLPATSPGETDIKQEKVESIDHTQPTRTSTGATSKTQNYGKESLSEPPDLLPARNPHQHSLFDLFPFSLLVKCLTQRGKQVKGKKAAFVRAMLRRQMASHNLPLEISLYLSSYIAVLQTRKCIDAATTSNLLLALNQLVDALTGLERILTTPIPFSYSTHLWTVTILYCFFLPFQLWLTLRYLTIPGTIIASFTFFGFLVAGEEIENPFGYDKNDLNLDHFTNGIIRQELEALSAMPMPDPNVWVFSSINDRVFSPHLPGAERITPEEWVSRGTDNMHIALSNL